MRIDDFPPNRYVIAWEWMQENPAANLDDYGPQTLAAFEVEMDRRRAAGELVYGVWTDENTAGERLVGIIGWRPMGPRWAMFHGICFDQCVRGTPLTRNAVRFVLTLIFDAGFDKVSAWFFADNVRVHRFLLALGAVSEAYLAKQTRQQGQPVDMRLLSFFKDDF